MSTDRFMSCTEDPAGKRVVDRSTDSKRVMIFTIARMLIPSLLAVSAVAQNPPDRGDPYVLRGNPKSPDGKYEWVVRTNNPIRYELINVRDGKEVVTVNAYHPDVNSSNIQYARASGIFWNKDGTVVALDELNRRRAGHLYFFILRNGTVHEIRAENIFPIPLYADECRVVVDPGWESGTKILVRQALKTRLGEFVSKYFTVDFANPDDPKIQPTEQ
jgi:hypothetical protein